MKYYFPTHWILIVIALSLISCGTQKRKRYKKYIFKPFYKCVGGDTESKVDSIEIGYFRAQKKYNNWVLQEYIGSDFVRQKVYETIECVNTKTTDKGRIEVVCIYRNVCKTKRLSNDNLLFQAFKKRHKLKKNVPLINIYKTHHSCYGKEPPCQ